MLRLLSKLFGRSKQSYEYLDDHRKDEHEDDRDWSTMPADILEHISDRLHLVDYIRFRSVCRQWRSSPSGRSELVNFSKVQPWLILYELEKNKTGTPKCYIYSQSRPQYCTIKLHDLEGAIVVESKLGWLLAQFGHFFYFYNPLTFSRINLPKLNVSGDYACTFTYLPTHQKCTITVVKRINESSLEVSMCCVGDKEWSTQTIPDVSSNQIGRIVMLVTCNHIHDDLCTSDLNKIHICDSNNLLMYDYVKKQKSLFYENWREVKETREPKKAEVETERQLEGMMKKKHRKEWGQKSGERGILITSWNKSSGKALIRFQGVDKLDKFDLVKGSFFEPKSCELGNSSVLEPKSREGIRHAYGCGSLFLYMFLVSTLFPVFIAICVSFKA